MRPRHPSHVDRTNPLMAWVADIGGSHITAALVERGVHPNVRERSSSTIDTHGDRNTLLRTISHTLRPFTSDAPRWTIALPGPFDYARGVGSFNGVEKFSSLAGLDLRAAFSAMLGIPPNNVTFINDAIAYGIGEWSVSDTRPERFVCITLGTGVGSAFLNRGHSVESGSEVPPHGWAHLLEINGAPLEDAVSTRAIQRRYAQEGGRETAVRDIAERARTGEDRARTVLEAAMFELGEALAPSIVSFRATEIVVGGSMARSWDVLGPAFERGIKRENTATISVRASRLFDDAPLIGAAARA
jgi:glucokinase